LVADDDSDDLELFSEAVRIADPSIVVQCAENGEDALNLLTTPSQDRPEVIVLDVNMPLMSGLECLQILKKHETLKDIPVIIYSTSSDPGDKRKAFAFDAYLFITKPFEFDVLKEIVSVLLKTPVDQWPVAMNNFSNVSFNEKKVVSIKTMLER